MEQMRLTSIVELTCPPELFWSAPGLLRKLPERRHTVLACHDLGAALIDLGPTPKVLFLFRVLRFQQVPCTMDLVCAAKQEQAVPRLTTL
jgi:hypothetical protein